MAEDSTETITIEYEFTREDYVRWQTAIFKHAAGSNEWRRFRTKRMWLTYLALGLTGACVYLGATRWEEIIDRQNLSLGGMIVGMGAAATGVWWQLNEYRKRTSPRAIRHHIERKADSQEGRAWQGQRRVTITPGFFIVDGKSGVSSLRWSHAARVIREDWLVFMCYYTGSRLPIPVRAFADEAAIQRFMSLAEKYKAAAPPGPREEMQALLKERDFACPGCKYNLRGTDGEKCPECGRAVTMEEVLQSKK